MKKTVVIDVVGLSYSLIGEHTPFLKNWMATKNRATINPMLPAVTTSVQSTYITGKWPAEHGIVGNGWYDHTDAEIKFWKQSNHLVKAEKIWERARNVDPNFTVSKMFWWYNMYSSADYSVTPRPQYLADGRKMPDCYSQPADLRDRLQAELGTFPLFQFWGPGANIVSTRWIADASLLVDKWHNPTLTLIYLPHLDYCLQKFGGQDLAKIAPELKQIDDVCRDLITHYEKAGAEVMVLSEYGITPVSRPVHINRVLREANLIQVRVERGLELLDAGASRAFAVSDHQVAHVYVNDQALLPKVRALCEQTPGVELVLDREGQKAYHIDHERAGDLVLMADAESWFTYYYWLDDRVAPDFARLVDIHRKPGYDPVEMFMDPANPLIKLRAGYKLLRKKLGFRYLMDVIPLDATIIRGSHGRVGTAPEFHPVLIGNSVGTAPVSAVEVYDKIWAALER
ncbi:alkaline phosphatase family protein [Rudanella paleaurantiibacter]|uniref:Alkaline phosphatase family protein n=1 Tax=Rudanella paleaurantiibacter TaxID=2614655 RepID=A0A7J5U282_9BACT|nr:nucleotide pyrophosphatase/phosphodiesterase family protein [Rudanella paleaurantiibacter]KAB7731796.1 alkaline phosphatase family protein [Rudanella paleaurantiibacter]